MDLLLVRHAESEGNALGLMQGLQDFPLSERGKGQARRLGSWLAAQGIRWDRAYCSPLLRAHETATIVCEATGHAAPELEPDLVELAAGTLEGLDRRQMAEQFPLFLQRHVTEIGDFGEFGGESYDQVQIRAQRLLDRLVAGHRASADKLLLVGHGGFHFQMLKLLICLPVPRICIVRMSNACASMVHLRERRGTFMGELMWHVPVDLMGVESGEGSSAIFR
jgi:broad specificity phosphatase PhoE